MKLSALYSVLLTDDVDVLSTFYQQMLGMEPTYESDWYVSLKLEGEEGSFQLALLQSNHPTIPEGFRRNSQGVIINLEVASADEIYDELITKGKLAVHLDIRDEPWGQRHFITSDPDNNLLDIIELIQPSEEFLTQYTEGLQ